MTDARYTVYIDKAYRNYYNTYPDAEKTFQYEGSNIEVRRLTHEEFINECQTNDDFANRWGCKIEIKELSLKERCDEYMKWSSDPKCVEWKNHIENEMGWDYEKPEWVFKEVREQLDKAQFPTKLITVIYNNEKIESYV